MEPLPHDELATCLTALLSSADTVVEPPLPPLSATNLAGLAWLGLVGAAATYALWFRGIARMEPGAVSMPGAQCPRAFG